MAIPIDLLRSRLFFTSSLSLLQQHHHRHLTPMLFLAIFCCSLFSFCFLFASLCKMLKRARAEDERSISNSLSIFRCSLPSTIINHKALPLFFDTLTTKLPKLASLIASFSHHSSVERDAAAGDDGPELDGGGGGGESVKEDCGNGEGQNGKKKKKRAKRNKSNLQSEDVVEEPSVERKSCSDSFYPFTSSSSATQRKIKQQYDQLVKSHDSKALTLAQVSQFVNCLVEARNDLQHKSEIIQRKFTITKALLFKADRSSFDRLSQQIYKLEAEQKRLEEDALVYNRLQQQLKLSPAYKQMLEIGARMELKASSDQLVESTDTEFASISFEELLAQEKKDTFWQKNGKLRSCTN